VPKLAKILLLALALAVCLISPVGAGPLVGDLDGNWKVDFRDLKSFADQWLVFSGASADFDGVNGVNLADFAMLARNWRKASGALVINEFMAVNDSNLPDPEDPTRFWDWIEIYNPADVNVDLNGWYLKYQPVGDSTLTKWKFPSVELDPGEFLVVFASEQDHNNPTRPLHTNFKLRGSGAYLGLVTNDGVTISHEYAPQYPEQLGNISYGLPQNATTLVPTGALAYYHVPASGDAGKPWTTVGFSDSGWDTGKTALGFGSAPVETGQDIGNPSAAGSYALNDGVYTVKGDGDDIWDPLPDAFYYVYAPLKGDGELTARVVSMTYTHDWGKAGVMVRETLDGDSKHAMTVVTPGSGTDFQYRIDTGGVTGNAGPTAHQAPYWVRIKRTGSTFTGYVSPDGSSWSQQGSTTIEMAEEAYIGLCVTSHAEGVLCTAVFDNVKGSGDVTSNLKQKMLGVNASLWTRLKFNLGVGDADVFDRLTLRVKYEDGFVAYLNGQQVARRNAPASPLWDSTADSNRPNSQSAVFESINVTAYKSLLQTGTNVLAIQAMNDNKDDQEFLILPQLIAAIDSSIPEYFSTATPGTFNVKGAKGVVDDVSFSHERGFYDTPFYLMLCTDDTDAKIRYTVDGSRPTAVHGTLYNPASRPPIYKTTCVRAIAYKTGYLDSPVGTHTYIFLSDVKLQSPYGQAPGPNWPSGSVNGQIIDYGMDPDVVNNPTYKNLIDGALLAIPTVSLVTDLANLFNPATGIYVNAGAEGRGWERPCSVELIYPPGPEGPGFPDLILVPDGMGGYYWDLPPEMRGGFQVDAGVRIRGGYSTSGSNPKHAFRLFFRDEYGYDKLMYPLFADEGTDEFDHVDLRCSQNYSWAFEGDNKNTDVRDVFSRDVQGATDQPYTRSRYYHLYINGQYWGLFQTQERSEASFGASYMGGDNDDYDVMSSNWSAGRQMVPTDGDRRAFDRFYDETIAGLDDYERYYRVQGLNTDGTRNPGYERMLDVDNLIDFMIIEYYSGDSDGPGSRFGNIPNNTWGVYNRVNPDGWKWLHHDNEHTLGAGGSGGSIENLVEPFTTAGAQRAYFNPQWLHEQLMFSNLDYRIHFADHVYRHFFNNGVLTLAKARSWVQYRANQMDMAIIAESARWGDSKRSTPLTQNDWRTEINRLLYTTSDPWGRKTYLTPRVDTVLPQFKNVGWYPNLNPPTFNQNGGAVSEGFNLIMTNPNGSGTIYYTLDGNDPRLSAAQSSGSTVTLVAENATKRVLVPTGPVVANTGSILREYWTDIAGAAVSDLTSNPAFPNNPSGSDLLTIFEAPTDWANYYGTRVRGYLHPTTSGSYTFWIASDDGSELWLSTNENPANKVKIASVPGWTPSRQWGRYTEQQSALIPLTGGKKYYIEALQKEHDGGDNLAVTWNVSYPNPINGQYLSPFGDIWATNYFDDSGWNDATFISGKTGGVGYDADNTTYKPYISYDVQAKMYGTTKRDTCYIRIPFTTNNTEFTRMTLKVRYDDGFIAYLNGTEVARRNFSGTPAWNSSATGANPDSAAVIFEDIDISSYRKALRQGNNILAIHGLNKSDDRSDFLISVELVANQAGQGDVSPTAKKYTGPVTLTDSICVKARVLDSTWSALNEAVYAIGPVAENLRITEIMYHPQDANDPNEEFIELMNIGPQTLNLNLVKFTNGIDFTFPPTELAAGDFVVVVKNLPIFQAKYDTGINVAGQYTGSLENAGERIQMEDALGKMILDFKYADGWREITDGNSFSLTIINPADPNINHWGKKDFWRASAHRGGSPGEDDSDILPNPGDVVINEVLAHSHAGAPDWIELANTTDQPIPIGGWYLSDSASNLKKYKIASETSIPGNGYKVFYEDTDFNDVNDPGCIVPFALSENGDTVYLSSAENGVLTGYREVEDFGASLTDVSLGRTPKLSTGNYNFVAMSSKTPEGLNAEPKVGPIVINEIMYNPDWPDGGSYSNDEYEYVELYNISGSAVTLYDSITHEPWKFTDGIEYTFPASPAVTIPAGGYIVVVRNKTAFSNRYSSVPSGKIYGPYSGHLNNGGESLELSQPGDVDELGERHYIRVDRINYSDGSHPEDCPGGVDLWPVDADGWGYSLSRKLSSAYGNDPGNWSASFPSPAVINP
jgi:hypothetical protein